MGSAGLGGMRWGIDMEREARKVTGERRRSVEMGEKKTVPTRAGPRWAG